MGKTHSRTTDEALKQYQIGMKVRALRMRKKIGLVELGSHTGLSPALLSKIENGKLHPPLPTLLRIAMVFGVGLDYFFTDESKRHQVAVVRREERQRFPSSPERRQPSYYFESLDFPVTDKPFLGYLAEFEDVEPAKAQVHQHPGFELLYLMSGTLGMRIGQKDFDLRRGDSIYFDCVVPHQYWRVGAAKCQAVVVTTA